MAGGGTGLDLPHFVKMLVMISVYGLSKTTAFASLYKTPEAKIEVMLTKWGFTDPLRLKLIKSRLAPK